MATSGPVHDGYFADPFVWRHGELYYAIGTGAEEAASRAADGVFPMLRSPDLVTWQPIGRALVRPDAHLGDACWAPEVAFADGRFHLYYSVGHGDRGHHLRVATSLRPEGPYQDSGRALTDPAVCAFAIDPHPFRDRDGRWYLFHARDFLDCDAVTGVRAGTALVVQPLAGMDRLVGEPQVVLRARHDWQRFRRDRPMYGATYDWHTLEGPAVCRHGGRYYCFFSGGCWQDRSYGVDYVVADAVLGPYADTSRGDGPRVLRSRADRIGPGHNSLVCGPDGRTMYLAYHAWDAHMSARRMFVEPLVWTADGPRVEERAAPTPAPGP
jgi:arabinan endo-1,5-alpha-L-arabinosidase